MHLKDRIYSSLMSGIIGDALGVPDNPSSQKELALCSIKNMVGYGRYDQPRGTWSDDTSLTLCTVESLLKGYELNDVANMYCKWLFDSYMTPSGFVFDSGLTTFMALEKIYNDKVDPRESGCMTEDDNGNGSLMRILPAALYFHYESVDTFLSHIHEISSITHAHPRSLVGCGMYSLIVRKMCTLRNKEEAFRKGIQDALAYYNLHEHFKRELNHYMRIISYQILDIKEDDISMSGYVVDTLEASLWSFLTGDSTSEILTRAVNLGLETDTTGMVAGGLAGLQYGLADVPEDWIHSLARSQEITGLIQQFADAAVSEEN